MTRPRCADDFAAIRARMAELRDQRAQLAQSEDARVMPEPSLYPGNVSAVLGQRPGIPGWRVARRRRQLSQT